MVEHQRRVREEEIRPAALMEGQRIAMEADISWLRAKRDSFNLVACPACESNQPIELYEKFAMTHVLCGSCGTQYVSPRPSEALLAEFYRQSANYAYWAQHIFPASREARLEKLFRPRAAFAARLVEQSGLSGTTMLEVGAAYGLFCGAARETGAFGRIVALEPTPDLAAICRGMELETIEAPYEATHLNSSVGMIASFEVIEHLHDPGRFLSWCRDQLMPGGLLLLTCPNIKGLETLALGREAGAVDHEHINLFHPDSIRLLLERHGFTKVSVDTPGELDVELVRAAYFEGRVGHDSLGSFLTTILDRRDPSSDAALQDFVKAQSLSAHMRIVAVRP